ncbi:MAG: hypothetical protein K0Q87_3844, partial [Neobacillus sp.]|nr:hypothetical protein [Neobacillus sp.]
MLITINNKVSIDNFALIYWVTEEVLLLMLFNKIKIPKNEKTYRL